MGLSIEQQRAIVLARARTRKEPAEEPEEEFYELPGDLTISKESVSPSNIAGAALEPLMTLGSGGLAMIGSGLAGVGDIINTKLGFTDTDPEERANMVSAIQEKYTYQPRTEGGKTATEAMMYPFEKYIEHVSQPVGEAALRTTGSPGVATIADTIMQAPLFMAGGRGARRLKAEVPEGASLPRRTLDTTVSAPKKVAGAVLTGAGHVVEPIIPGRQRKIAGRALNEVTGRHRQDVVDALNRAEPGETAGQAAVGSGSHEFSALQKLAEREDPSKFAAIKEAQMKQRMDSLGETGKTPGDLALAKQTRAENAAENYSPSVMNQRIDPRSPAQMLADKARMAEIKALEAEISKAHALRDWGRLKTLEAQMQQLAKGEMPLTGRAAEQSIREGARYNTPQLGDAPVPPRYAGEVTAPERYAPQTPRSKEAGVAAEEALAISKKRLNQEQGLNQAQQTMLVNMIGEDSPALSKFLSRPSVQRAIQTAREAAAETGSFFPKEGEQFSVANLQRIKRAIADEIKTKRKEGTLDATKANEIGDTLTSFNDWIKSKSEGFKVAEEAFAAESIPINRMKVMQVLMEGLEPIAGSVERANKFITAILQGEKTVKSATGREISLKEIFTEEQLAAIDKAKSELQRDRTMKEQSVTGAPAMKQKMAGAIPHAAPPGILERSIFVARAILNRIHGKGTKGTTEYITERMNSPAEMARIMEEATPTERAVLDNWLKARNQSLVSGAIAAQPQENQ